MESDNTDIKWALDLLAFDPLYEPHFIAKYWLQIPSCVLGPGLASYINHYRGRSYFARPYLHVGLTAGFLFLSHLIDDFTAKRYARRDAILRDYIIRHPEDFPPPERKKFGDIFDSWVPIR